MQDTSWDENKWYWVKYSLSSSIQLMRIFQLFDSSSNMRQSWLLQKLGFGDRQAWVQIAHLCHVHTVALAKSSHLADLLIC